MDTPSRERREHVPLRQKVLPSFGDVEPIRDTAAYGMINLMISGLIAFGLPGYLLDRWLGTSFLVVFGLAVGMALALTVGWFRYGTGRRTAPNPFTGSTQADHDASQSTTEQTATTRRTTEDHG